ncbi:MAG TPA: ATP-binding protein [Xanthobacteraceae bacterium]|nr:ATP-binding protein [Xanthobacteraceae bacterium]
MARKRSTTIKPQAPRRKRGAAPRRGPADARERAIMTTLAELAHEIRTPLTGILSLSELLASSELGERERGWAVAIKSAAEHLAMLTSLIVDAARAGAKGLVLRRELVRPRRLAQTLGASLAARADAKGLKAELVIAPSLPEAVIGDPLRLRGAIENLIDNAVKFTERGTVKLEAGAEQAVRGRVRLRFTISDTGIGLEPRELRRLFRPFTQGSDESVRRFGGAGLGLSLVKRVAKAMGGDLKVTSRPGSGSRFELTALVDPVAEAATAAEGDGSGAGNSTAPLRPLKILCAEDNPYGRVVLNTILSELGHRADFVGTGSAAVEAAARGGYDAVLMDVTLPGLDGLDATRRIRALDSPANRVAVIGISGRANTADEAAGRAAGMSGYLVKPISPAALTRLLASLVGSA